ncbi:thermonuclease family protein [uncultured Desulfovibrio sp.]|uniref:thermonuclease family protein n=1 Tax=uncultured Desulfovibrio sp. TaxID=167968 RepID=UPI0026398048|nr:thermonuclease family protein [uncultured Desulfovibrio sp.]
MSVLSLLPVRLLRLLPLLPLLLVALFYASPLPAQDELPPGTATDSVDTAAVQRPALPPLAAPPQAAVAVCLDGDTLKLTSRRTVRLAGIDTPEMGKRDKKPQYYAREARELLNELSRGQDVTLYQPSNKQQDKYGRLIADICLPDGRSLNALMVEAGAAFFYPHADLDPAYQDWLKSLQAAAIHERRGMWAWILTQPFALKSYTGNKESRRFFPAASPDAQRIKPRNRVHFGTLMDAFLAGYAPARQTNPWPEAEEK